MNTNEKIFKAFNTINAEVKENIFKPKLAINNSDRRLFWTNWNQKLVNRILDIKSKQIWNT